MAPGRPSPRENVHDPAESRARIAGSALPLFAHRGYAGTSVKAIANDVGLSTPALYWHFNSKDDIYVAAIEQMLGNFLNAIREAVHSTEPRPRFQEFVSAHVRFSWSAMSRPASTLS